MDNKKELRNAKEYFHRHFGNGEKPEEILISYAKRKNKVDVDFYTELMNVINKHVNNGLSKPDLVKQMKYATESCEMS